MIFLNVMSNHWAATVVLSIFAILALTSWFLFGASVLDHFRYQNQQLPVLPGISEEDESEVVEEDSLSPHDVKVSKEDSVFTFDDEFDFEGMDEDAQVVLKDALDEQDSDRSGGSTKVSLDSFKNIKFIKGKK